MWLHRQEEGMRVGCVEGSLLDLIYHAHKLEGILMEAGCGGDYQDLL